MSFAKSIALDIFKWNNVIVSLTFRWNKGMVSRESGLLDMGYILPFKNSLIT